MIERARRNGIEFLINVGYDLESSRSAVSMVGNGFYASVGYHPHDAKNFKEEVFELAEKAGVVAIGETGLDYYRDLSPREVQREIFIKQLAFAKDRNMPVIIHTRNAFEDLFPILEKFRPRGVLHAFSGDEGAVEKGLSLGLYFGIGGTVTFKNAKIREVVRSIPLDKIVLETDSPFLTPHPWRGKRNEPAYLLRIAGELSSILGVSLEKLAEITTSNARELFGI